MCDYTLAIAVGSFMLGIGFSYFVAFALSDLEKGRPGE